MAEEREAVKACCPNTYTYLRRVAAAAKGAK